MSADTLRTSDTALGDWYVNRIVVDRRPLLLLVSSTSLLPILVPARAVRGLPARLASVVDARLRHLGLNDRLIVSETGAMETVMIGPTIDRSVLGIMVDFAKGLPHYLEPGPWDETALIGVEQRLAETPCRASQRSERVIFPDSKAPELLRMQWMARLTGRWSRRAAHGLQCTETAPLATVRQRWCQARQR